MAHSHELVSPRENIMNIVVCLMPTFENVDGLKLENGEFALNEALVVGLNPWDEYAIEAALRVKETYHSEVTAVSQGQESSIPVLRKAIAMGCDEAKLVKTSNVLEINIMAYKKFISSQGVFDIVFMGKQAIDTENAIAPIQLAKLLGWKILSCVTDILDIRDGFITVIQNISEKKRRVKAKLPVVVSVDKEFGEPRKPTYKLIRTATQAKIDSIILQDLQADFIFDEGLKKVNLTKNEPNLTNCEFLEGPPKEIAETLLSKLKDLGIIL